MEGKKTPLNVVKVGGAVVEDPRSLDSLLQQFAALSGRKVLVHGGGRRATDIARRLGIESVMVGGRRVTDPEMLKVVTMVYGGLINKDVVAKLQARGVNAIGLTGADMDVIRSHRRPTTRMVLEDGMERDVDFGFVGDVDRADAQALDALIGNGMTPVVAPLTHDGEGNMLNTNADTIASTVACALAPLYDVTLTFCFEKRGVLENPDCDDSVIKRIDKTQYSQLKASHIVAGGMIPKLDNAFQALDRGVGRVVITSAGNVDGSMGTTICP